MEIKRTAVMRRCRDNWLNGTQILKVAGLRQEERRKVLNDIKGGQIRQKGYARGCPLKYLGTWVDFGTGLRLCECYGVDHLLLPLLTYNMGGGGVIRTLRDLRVISCSPKSSRTIDVSILETKQEDLQESDMIGDSFPSSFAGGMEGEL
jgi:hypothetical protein